MRQILLTRRAATFFLLSQPVVPSILGQEPKKKAPTQPSTLALQNEIHNALGKVNTGAMEEKEQRLKETLLRIRNYQQLISSNPENRASLEKARDKEIGTGVRITSEILDLLGQSGLTQIVLKNRNAFLKGFSAKSLPPEDLAILKEAGFSSEEIDQFIAFFAANGDKILSRLDPPGGVDQTQGIVKKHADQPPSSPRFGSYLKLLGGGAVAAGNVVIGGDGLPVLASIGMGLGMIADAVRELWQ